MSGAISLRGALLAFAVLATAVFALMSGQVQVGLGMLLRGAFTGEGPGATILTTFRGPRVATALGAGALFGLSGALFQTLFRNPLASPDLMGFTWGAALAVVTAVAFAVNLPMAAVAAAGGLLTAAAVGLASFRPGHATPPLTLILVGLGIGFMCSALATFVMTILPTNEAAVAQRWMAGSLAARDWSHAAQVWGPGLVLTLLLLAQTRALAALELGEDLAAGLGLRVARARRGLVVTGVLLAATAVAVAGPVAFVALMAAPLGTRLTRARSIPGRMLSAAGAGAIVLTLSDLIARSALPGIELPAGVMTGILGAPYLLWRLAREMERGGL